jgi:uncharacterized protein (DUF4415 family)
MTTDSATDATDETAETAEAKAETPQAATSAAESIDAEPAGAEAAGAESAEAEATAGRRKQKVSLSLDPDLIRQLKAAGPLSPQVNEAIRAQLAHQQPASTGADD